MCFYRGRFYLACDHFEFNLVEFCKAMKENTETIIAPNAALWRAADTYMEDECKPRVYIFEYMNGRPVVLQWKNASDTSVTNVVEWADALVGGWCTRCFNIMRTSEEAGLLALQQGARIMYHLTPQSTSIFDIPDTRPILWYPPEPTGPKAAGPEVKQGSEEEQPEEKPEEEQQQQQSK
ncbi:uncharacterized protein N7483_000573 [Penicillium malachiteum]|uniref:uncharacterized protein n=1 Tax=Penicillium malachiteum TaxID=1324776 RepID=UPI002548209A|nr:uncharacterized protein N7483_000573 [Penicillium malachiteum]KAJ5735448.1 hypothetical protein N7483_000573 [Penicillium malachiteum]